MPEAVTLDLDQEQVAESTLSRVLDQGVQAGKDASPNDPAAASLARLLAQEIKAVLPHVLSAPERVQRRWEQLCSIGWAGQTADVHAARGPFLSNVEGKLQLTEQARRLAEMVVLLTGQALPEQEALKTAERGLQEFKSTVFGRWQTLEDLEDMLAAAYPLNEDKLEVIGKNHPAPPAWYAEEEKPF